jgi:hypothetical protein
LAEPQRMISALITQWCQTGSFAIFPPICAPGVAIRGDPGVCVNPADGGPRVRILLPPAKSLLRTLNLDWSVAPAAAKGALFLCALVALASLMPVEKLPSPSWVSVFALGILSSVFDNIPLTALALEQGGYDWPLFAYAAGFGGSMIWFGSSAGVALVGSFPEGRSVTAWLQHGWHIGVAYVVGFFVMLALRGWTPAVG